MGTDQQKPNYRLIEEHAMKRSCLACHHANGLPTPTKCSVPGRTIFSDSGCGNWVIAESTRKAINEMKIKSSIA